MYSLFIYGSSVYVQYLCIQMSLIHITAALCVGGWMLNIWELVLYNFHLLESTKLQKQSLFDILLTKFASKLNIFCNGVWIERIRTQLISFNQFANNGVQLIHLKGIFNSLLLNGRATWLRSSENWTKWTWAVNFYFNTHTHTHRYRYQFSLGNSISAQSCRYASKITFSMESTDKCVLI